MSVPCEGLEDDTRVTCVGLQLGLCNRPLTEPNGFHRARRLSNGHVTVKALGSREFPSNRRRVLVNLKRL